ncbi:MAG: manganese efflux pump MntP family protein [Desulfomonilia bacterium]
MGMVSILLIALGLSMDCFAVSVSSGLSMERFRICRALRLALFFGLFQGIMPVIGFAAGMGVRNFIEEIDHWVAFGLLAFIGLKMIHEALTEGENGKKIDLSSLSTLLVLSVATSIDALAVGVSFSLLNMDIAVPALVIGIVAFAVSLTGVLVGRRVGRRFKSMAEILGGLILIAIGLKILMEHLG